VYRLSRYAIIRPHHTGFLVESLIGGRALALESAVALQVLLAFARPTTSETLLQSIPEAARPAMRQFVALCHRNRILSRVFEDGRAEEDAPALEHWEIADLFFHVRSRRGRTPWPVGATFHLRGRLAPEPAFKPNTSACPIRLNRPDLAQLRASDVSLTEALERRRSVYSVVPLELRTLGEFLYRTCRVTEVLDTKDHETFAHKVYPSGGSLHSLEVYIVAAACHDLPRGLYYYHSTEHALFHLSDFTPDVEELSREAQRGTGRLEGLPPILLIFGCRFRRVMWKYQGLAYHVVLQEVGALYQTMYLVATSMGLSPSAIGAGDADRFAQLAGTDYFAESSVGEFILGGPPPSDD
jgi:SagB-type dehydrogenase family enzyme